MAATTGLPASAKARLARFTDAAPFTSFLSAPAATSLAAVGLEPVGDVMGCATTLVSREWTGLCSGIGPSLRVTSGSSTLGGRRSVFYQERLRDLYARTLARLIAEATAVGADGVVGIELTRTRHEALQEAVAVGTAVRAQSRSRPTTVFTTDLAAPDVAKLMFGGWVPVQLHVAVALGLRHNDRATIQQSAQTARNSVNIEVSGYTDLMRHANSQARRLLHSATTSAGADGCLLSHIGTETWGKGCERLGSGGDHVALTIAVGSSVARFGSGTARARTLTIMPVGTAR